MFGVRLVDFHTNVNYNQSKTDNNFRFKNSALNGDSFSCSFKGDNNDSEVLIPEDNPVLEKLENILLKIFNPFKLQIPSPNNADIEAFGKALEEELREKELREPEDVANYIVRLFKSTSYIDN